MGNARDSDKPGRKERQNTVGREADGKFNSNNRGRPKGALNKSTQVVQELLASSSETLTQKALDLALEGDTTALRLCLERIAPPRKDVPVSFYLPPIESAQDAAQAAQAVLRAVSEGDITPLEGASVMGLVEGFRKVLEASDFEARIAALEERK